MALDAGGLKLGSSSKLHKSIVVNSKVQAMLLLKSTITTLNTYDDTQHVFKIFNFPIEKIS